MLNDCFFYAWGAFPGKNCKLFQELLICSHGLNRVWQSANASKQQNSKTQRRVPDTNLSIWWMALLLRQRKIQCHRSSIMIRKSTFFGFALMCLMRDRRTRRLMLGMLGNVNRPFASRYVRWSARAIFASIVCPKTYHSMAHISWYCLEQMFISNISTWFAVPKSLLWLATWLQTSWIASPKSFVFRLGPWNSCWHNETGKQRAWVIVPQFTCILTVAPVRGSANAVLRD